MNIYAPFANVTEMAERSFFTVEEIERRAHSEFEYNRRMFDGMVINAVQHKEYREQPERVRSRNMVSESIDIRKTWPTSSRQVKGNRPYETAGVMLK